MRKYTMRDLPDYVAIWRGRNGTWYTGEIIGPGQITTHGTQGMTISDTIANYLEAFHNATDKI